MDIDLRAPAVGLAFPDTHLPKRVVTGIPMPFVLYSISLLEVDGCVSG